MATCVLTYKPDTTGDHINLRHGGTYRLKYLESENEPADWSKCTVNSIEFEGGKFDSNFSNTFIGYLTTSSRKLWKISAGGGASYFPSGTVASADYEHVLSHGNVSMQASNSNKTGSNLIVVQAETRHTFTIDYTDGTTACTPPSSVSLDTTTQKLTITGGSGGTYNAFAAYGISSSTSDHGADTWSDWSEDTVTASAIVNVIVSSGKDKKFRVRTRGEAGEGYFSEYVVCDTILEGNSGTSTPEILFPSDGTTTHDTSPIVKLHLGADPDGDTMHVYRAIDEGEYASIGTIDSGDMYDTLTSLGEGLHTISYKANDGTYDSPVVTVTFTVGSVEWGRTIASGDVISNAEISHRADINEMKAAAEKIAMYYDVSFSLPGTVGRFGDWKKQMEAFETLINAVERARNESETVFATVPAYPTASVINAIRSSLEVL